MTTEFPAPAPGLRARKKQRTRDELLRAALELFTSQGYEETTVDEISEAVQVSQRTFFRHFSSKEDAAFRVQDLIESHFVTTVSGRPPGEAPLEAMRRAVLDAWNTVGEAIEALVPLELHMRTYQLIESTPSLLATHMRRSADLEEVLARVIAEREGLDVDEDPRPRLVVAAFSGVMRMTGRRWGAGNEATVESIREITAAYLDRFESALAADWHRG
ncbi:TetR/AcrR family transcriptional regulator [Streptomyces physcomitrii]|uniref:TetR family transcriptional regulator n=1 Tax=Streptomyces physcomitrii TaxID=2724184 RepID=A0ABX1H4W2_9ACTN|nr:TetR family transcriptional regulator [Streptomyces physcomitrii]NKI43103.1 TetR family transcriptional regulator [Streptomyces physcomitrii]